MAKLAATFDNRPTTAFKAVSDEKTHVDPMTIEKPRGPVFRVHEDGSMTIDGHVMVWNAPLWVWFVFTFSMSVSTSVLFVWLFWAS